MATVKARKVFFFQLFLVYPSSTRIHFSWHSKHGLVAVGNYSRVKVLMTTTKVGGCPCPGRSLSDSPSPSRTRRNPPEQSVVNRQMQNRLDVVVSKPFLENSSNWDWFPVPVEKTLLLERYSKQTVCQRYWLPPTCSKQETVFASSLYLGLLYIFYFFTQPLRVSSAPIFQKSNLFLTSLHMWRTMYSKPPHVLQVWPMNYNL